MDPKTAGNLVTTLAQRLHNYCLDLAPKGHYQEIYQSFVCGSNLESPELHHTYVQLGLIHVVVVSGAHLVFLESLLRGVGQKWAKSYWILPTLLIYTLVTKFEPPVVRSMAQLIIQRIQKHLRLNWPRPLTTLIAGILTLMALGSSRALSLQLSWIASLALHPQTTPLRTQLRVYALLLPILATLQMPHPISLITNISLAPALSTLAFPLSLLCFLVPGLSSIVDPLWEYFHMLLYALQREISPMTPSDLYHWRPWLWPYLAIAQALALYWHTKKKRSWL